jgi:thiopeptide-type bacteriocin biosynthesis protein
MGAGNRPHYCHTGVALLRSAVRASAETPEWWPDPDDAQASRVWLRQIWSRPAFADAVEQASPTLARRVEVICVGQATAKQVRRATVTTAGYALRALGRPTPFGLFAGVAPVSLGREAALRWGGDHRPTSRVDTQWLADVIDRLEACLDLLERLDVVFTNLAVRRGGRLEAPYGPGRVHLRYTSVVRAVQDTAATPMLFGALADKLAETFGADRSTAASVLTELVRQGFLITCLRAPLTITDPLTHLLDKLRGVGAETLPSTAPLVRDLRTVQTQVRQLNAHTPDADRHRVTIAAVGRRMRQISPAGRIPLAVDLRLDCDVRLPEPVAQEMTSAASALLRLTRHPTGWPAWHDYHAAFCDRYGTGTLVPVTEVVNPDIGLGYPAGYPGSVLPAPVDVPAPRDERLLALAWQTVTEGGREIVLTDEIIRAIAGDQDGLNPSWIPPHVELAARIHATDVQALQRGQYALMVAPARAGGTLTSRFTPTTTSAGLHEVYRGLPVTVEGALPVQLSFPPAYPHAENVCRIPPYLPDVLSLGEHRGVGDQPAMIPLGDLAVTATGQRLHLVSMFRRQVIEPQVFHALALDKQPPPLARFLAHLPRAYCATWTVLDWGPAAERLAYLPRVRYRRSVLAPARWRLTTSDLPRPEVGQDAWRRALASWRARLSCPSTVELRDDDRTLSLVLDELAHAAILHSHLARHGHATLTEANPPAAYGWLDGHAHEVVVPMAKTGAAAPCPLVGSLPVVTNSSHGQWPGDRTARWLCVRIHAHPERHDEIIADRLPELVAHHGGAAQYWFVRYRSPHQTDHLRLRLPNPDPEHYGACMAAVGQWAQRLQHDGLAGRLVFDGYHPEVGRYGAGTAMQAAEGVFVADSQAVSAQLRHLPAGMIHPSALAAVSFVHIACELLGPDQGMRWLAAHPATPPDNAPDRTVADEVIRLTQPGALAQRPGWPGQVAQAWHDRAESLAVYRSQLPTDAQTDTVVESLLHMHHNRAIGVDPNSERTCRRLAHQAARAWQARQPGDNQ